MPMTTETQRERHAFADIQESPIVFYIFLFVMFLVTAWPLPA